MSQIHLNQYMIDLLKRIDPHVVVVGSFARNKPNPKDLDVLWNMDSPRAEAAIKKAVDELGLTFTSEVIGNWTFSADRCFSFYKTVQVEILPIHAGPSYAAVRRKAERRQIVPGLELWVARPEDAPPLMRSDT